MAEQPWRAVKANGLQVTQLVRMYKKCELKRGALLSTSATVLADDPSLNVRWNQFPDDLKAEYAEETVRQLFVLFRF